MKRTPTDDFLLMFSSFDFMIYLAFLYFQPVRQAICRRIFKLKILYS